MHSEGWLAKLVGKLPTLSGIGSFIYVLTNWASISRDLKTRDERVQATEEWARLMLSHENELHELEKAKLARKLQHERDQWYAVASRGGEIIERMSGKLDRWIELLDRANRDVQEITMWLAIVLSKTEPAIRNTVLGALNPNARQRLEHTLAKLAAAPPPIQIQLSELVAIAESVLTEIGSLHDDKPGSDVGH